MQVVEYNGTKYRVDDANIVDDVTNIVVSTSLANEISERFGIVVAQQAIESAHRIDPNYLNLLIKNKIQK